MQDMPAITIRDVPTKTRNELAARAARNGQSLQQYLRSELEALAERESLDEVLDRVRRRKAAQPEAPVTGDIVDLLRADRRR